VLSFDYLSLIENAIITEKTNSLFEYNKFTFVVNRRATKKSVKFAIEKFFDIKVSKVNIINVNGKVKKFKGKLGKRKDVKKAIVTFAEGQNIDAFQEKLEVK